MSGGSLNYLFCKETPDLFEAVDDLKRVELHLLQRGDEDIAKDVRRLIEYIKTAENRIDVLRENLAGVFKAVEWNLSADWGDARLQQALDRYRNGEEMSG